MCNCSILLVGKNMKYFLDNASTTSCLDAVNKEMLRASMEDFYNPGALYSQGFEIRKKLDDARDILLKSINGNGYKVVFTASATESNNLALNQVKKNAKVIIGGGEHPSIYETALSLKNRGANVVFAPLNKDGYVDIEKFKEIMQPDVDFVSIMHVSNETGNINPISALCQYAKSVNPNVIFHVDGVQAFLKINVSITSLGVDMYTISSHKVHGPKGVGALIYKSNLHLKPELYGGGQEQGVRSGTENYPLIAGFVKAIQETLPSLNDNLIKVQKTNEALIQELRNLHVNFEINGAGEKSPYILSLSFLGVRGEVLLHMLEEYGILVSTGSACSTKKIGNRILQEMGKNTKQIEGNLRVSFDAMADVDVAYVAKAINECVNK